MANNKCPKCDHIKRPILQDKITPEVAESMAQGYRTLPMFEKGLFEYNRKKYYSLKSNEYLKCRWVEYKANYTYRVLAPVRVLDVRDYHFYNYLNCLAPSESVTKRDDQRRKLRLGPGVDSLGQVPIPDELVMKRGPPKKSNGRVKDCKINKNLKAKHK